MIDPDKWQLGGVTKGRSTMHVLAIKDARAMLNNDQVGRWPLRDILTTAGQLMTWQGTQADMLQVAACEQYIHEQFYSSWLDEMSEREANRYV